MKYLVHHGIKGQKWGVRRWQNADGSLTSAGRNHYIANPEGGYHVSNASPKTKTKISSEPNTNKKISSGANNKNPKKTEDDKDAIRARRKKIALVTAGVIGAAAAGAGIAYGVKKYKSASDSMRNELNAYGKNYMGTKYKQQSMMRKMEERAQEKDWSLKTGHNIAQKYMDRTTNELNSSRAHSKGSNAISKHLSDSTYDALAEKSYFGRKVTNTDIAKAIAYDTKNKIGSSIGKKKKSAMAVADNLRQKASDANPLNKVKSDLKSYGSETSNIDRKQGSMTRAIEQQASKKNWSFDKTNSIAKKYYDSTESERDTLRSAAKSKSKLTKIMSDDAYDSLARRTQAGALGKHESATIAKSIASGAAKNVSQKIKSKTSAADPTNKIKSDLKSHGNVINESLRNINSKSREVESLHKLSYDKSLSYGSQYTKALNSKISESRSAAKSKSKLTKIISDDAYDSLARRAQAGKLSNSVLAKEVVNAAGKEGKKYIELEASKGVARGRDYVAKIYGSVEQSRKRKAS